MIAFDNATTEIEGSVEGLIRELNERFEGGRVELPLLSESVQRVIQATSREDSDARSIADLIKRDQAFAGHVLRVSSSPLFAAKSPVVSLQQAVSRLGMKQVREVALMISMETRVFSVKGFETDVRALFRHAIATGLYAQELARSRRANVEEAFLAGLLHDVGKPIVLQAVMDATSVNARFVRSERDLVMQVVESMHARVGQLLTIAWKLPTALADTIANHHDSSSRSGGVHALRLADDLAHLAMGDEPIEEAFVRDHPMIEELNLYPEDLEQLLSKREEIASIAGASA